MYEELKKVGQDGYFLYLHYRHGLYPPFFYYTICQHAHQQNVEKRNENVIINVLPPRNWKQKGV